VNIKKGKEEAGNIQYEGWKASRGDGAPGKKNFFIMGKRDGYF